MRRFFWLTALLLAAVAALIGIARSTRVVARLVPRWNQRGRPAGAAVMPAMKGHPLFAATYDFVTQWGERRLFGKLRASLVGEAGGRVLEIGAGTGANFPYYRSAEKVVATEPDPFMLWRAQKRAQGLGLDVEIQQVSAEALPFPDASFDTVVSTLVLCTVTDPDRALAEVRRVLEPSGTFRFVEHVRAEGGLLARVQDLATPVWRQCGAGCHLNRRTAERIEAAGFEIVQMERRQLPLIPLIIGLARPKERTVNRPAGQGGGPSRAGEETS